MRVKEKRFYPDAIQHIYQRAVDRGVIFYHVEDRLVLLTTAAVNKRKYGIIIPAFAVMFTHIHQSAISRSRLLLSKYLQDTNSMVSRAYNLPTSLEGYKGYIRVKEMKMVTLTEDDYDFETYWSGLETVKVPKIGDPYIREGSVEDITSTSATARFAWAGNGQRISYLSCIYSTDRKDIENNIGTKVSQSISDATKLKKSSALISL